MIDGTYDLVAHTPVGDKDGQIVVSTDGNVCNATLIMLGQTNTAEGTLEGNTASFEGVAKLPFPLGKIKYTLVGTVEGDDLTAEFSGKGMTFTITGTRVA